MAYDTIHNITAKTQLDEVVQPGGSAIEQKKTSYDWSYEYGSSHPHAPTHLGERTYRYDSNGNQLGWDNDKNGTRRNIVWDDENRIQSVFDNGHEKTYKYDDQGERVIKRGPQGETAYINQWYTVRNREVASKHVYAGTTRIATSLVPGVKTGSFAPGNGAGNGKGNANGQVNAGTGGTTVDPSGSKLPESAQQAPGILKGNGLANRSAQAAANSRNLEKNPHYATSGGDTGGSTGGSTSAPGTASNQDNFLYYYHPDHLGSSSYVTDAYGKVFQHLEYFPFGETWVEESSNTQGTPYLFTAKELDEETGLYYFGARYYDPRTSVWQSADPVLSKYLPTIGNRGQLPGLGGAFNSANLGLYSYSHLNPLRYSDPDGRWPTEEVHYRKTKEWAIDVGMSEGKATKVARAAADVDSIVRGKSWMPVIGDQGYHFNTNEGGKDSRVIRHEEHFASAVNWGKRAASWRSNEGGISGWFKNLVADVMEGVSLNQLGKSLHPIQDMDAHTAEYSKIKLGVHYHDQEAFGTPDRADDYEGKVSDSRGKERLAITEGKTKQIIQEYLKEVGDGK